MELSQTIEDQRVEITRLKQMIEDLRRAHRANCPGCELCLPGSDYMRNRARPEDDIGPNGVPLKAGS